MSRILENIQDLNNLLISGKLVEAIEKYYDDEVVMQENSQPPFIGKKENQQRETEFLSNVTEFREAKVLDIAIGEDVSFVTWHFDYTHKEWGVRNYTQVSVQHWRNDKIVREQFFYGNKAVSDAW